MYLKKMRACRSDNYYILEEVLIFCGDYSHMTSKIEILIFERGKEPFLRS